MELFLYLAAVIACVAGIFPVKHYMQTNFALSQLSNFKLNGMFRIHSVAGETFRFLPSRRKKRFSRSNNFCWNISNFFGFETGDIADNRLEKWQCQFHGVCLFETTPDQRINQLKSTVKLQQRMPADSMT